VAATVTFTAKRRLGATPSGAAATEFTVWAPKARSLAVRVGGRDHALAEAGDGLWSGEAPAAPGDD
jgi:1,4-alpha-glucan branching enzyme